MDDYFGVVRCVRNRCHRAFVFPCCVSCRFFPVQGKGVETSFCFSGHGDEGSRFSKTMECILDARAKLAKVGIEVLFDAVVSRS